MGLEPSLITSSIICRTLFHSQHWGKQRIPFSYPSTIPSSMKSKRPVRSISLQYLDNMKTNAIFSHTTKNEGIYFRIRSFELYTN